MSGTDRSSLVTRFAAAVTDRFGERLSQAEQADLTALATDLLENVRAEAIPQPRVVTVLLADLRGFSNMVGTCSPTVLIDTLNHYFTRMCAIIHEHGGTIDKFMGDSVMALFGAPEHHADDLNRALCCATRMQQAMLEINRENTRHERPEIHAGIGINTGEVMVGNFGSAQHFEYTVIGDEVNLAARIEAYSLRGQILLSERCYERARDFIDIGSVNRVQVKGKDDAVTLYELRAVNEPERIEVPDTEVRKSPRVVVDLPLQFQRVRNKLLEVAPHQGRILDLGYNGMLACLPERLPPYTEIAFTLTPHPTSDEQSTLYAKVYGTRKAEDGFRTNLKFTSVDTPGHRAVKQYVDELLWGHRQQA